MDDFVTHGESLESPEDHPIADFSSNSVELTASLSDEATSEEKVATSRSAVYRFLPEHRLRRTKYRQYYSKFYHIKLETTISLGMNVLLRPDEEVDDEDAWAARVQEIFFVDEKDAKIAGKHIAQPAGQVMSTGGLFVSIRWYSRWGDCWMDRYWDALHERDRDLKKPFVWEAIETSVVDVSHVMAIVGICHVKRVSSMTADDWFQVCQQRKRDLEVDSTSDDSVEDASREGVSVLEEMDLEEGGGSPLTFHPFALVPSMRSDSIHTHFFGEQEPEVEAVSNTKSRPLTNVFFCYRRLKFSKNGEPSMEEFDAKPPNMHQFHQLLKIHRTITPPSSWASSFEIACDQVKHRTRTHFVKIPSMEPIYYDELSSLRDGEMPDSDWKHDTEWIRTAWVNRLRDYMDIGIEEKDFFTKWNDIVDAGMELSVVGSSRNGFIAQCVSELLENDGEWIASNERTWCVFTHHLSTLVHWKLMEVDEMKRWLALAQRFCKRCN